MCEQMIIACVFLGHVVSFGHLCRPFLTRPLKPLSTTILVYEYIPQRGAFIIYKCAGG